jgi:hypothetical protein
LIRIPIVVTGFVVYSCHREDVVQGLARSHTRRGGKVEIDEGSPSRTFHADDIGRADSRVLGHPAFPHLPSDGEQVGSTSHGRNSSVGQVAAQLRREGRFEMSRSAREFASPIKTTGSFRCHFEAVSAL